MSLSLKEINFWLFFEKAIFFIAKYSKKIKSWTFATQLISNIFPKLSELTVRIFELSGENWIFLMVELCSFKSSPYISKVFKLKI